MDPASFARAYGVQSESNRCTVTRVAAGEITYKRAVENYRRRMASTMIHIQREQKKLKRNVRDYRKKLLGSQGHPGRQPRSSEAGWVTGSSDSNCINIPSVERRRIRADEDRFRGYENTTMSGLSQKQNSSDPNSNAKAASKLQEQVDTFLKSVDDHIYNTNNKTQHDDSDDTKEEISYDRGGRYRFLYGPGELGSNKDAEYDHGGSLGHHDLLSDSSSDDGDHKDPDSKTSLKRNNRSRHLRDLTRLNSAYFKAIDSKEHTLHSVESSQELEIEDDGAGSEKDKDNEVENTSSKEGKGIADNVVREINPLGKQIWEFSLKKMPAGDDLAEKEENGQRLERNVKKEISKHVTFRKTIHTLKFRDLMRFNHGVNTKKLFHVVDQLASKYGVAETGSKNTTAKEPHQGLIHEPQVPESINQSGSKSSIFYAMKYGYDKRELPSKLENDINLDSPFSENPTGLHLAKIRPKSLNTLDEEKTEWLNSSKSKIERDSVDGMREADNKPMFPQILLKPVPHPDRSSKNTESDAGERENASSSSDKSHQPRNTVKNVNVFKKRRSSLLGASLFVSEMHRKSLKQEHDRLFGSESTSSSSLDAMHHRLPASLRKTATTTSEHQRQADDRKIAWSSALGRMKLVHTLADLTRFI